MNFKKWDKSIEPAGYNGARTVYKLKILMAGIWYSILNFQPESQMFNRLFRKCQESIRGKVVSFNFKHPELCNKKTALKRDKCRWYAFLNLFNLLLNCLRFSKYYLGAIQ